MTTSRQLSKDHERWTREFWFDPETRFQFKIFKWQGKRVYLSLSFFVVFFLLVLSLRFGLFPYYFASLTPSAYWLMSLITAIGMGASVLAHEMFHSLNDWRKVTSRWRRAGSYLASLGFNLFLALIFASLAYFSETNGKSEILVGVLFHLSAFNVTLFLFEALPALPLDGGMILLSLFSRQGKPVSGLAHVLFWVGVLTGVVLSGASVYQFLHGRPFIALWMWLVGLLLGKASFDTFDYLRPRKRKG